MFGFLNVTSPDIHTNSGRHLVLVHAEGALGLVKEALASATVDVLVLRAAGLVSERLASRLLVVWLDTAGDLVTSVGEGLANLVASGLGGVRLERFRGLCGHCQYVLVKQKVRVKLTYCRSSSCVRSQP